MYDINTSRSTESVNENESDTVPFFAIDETHLFTAAARVRERGANTICRRIYCPSSVAPVCISVIKTYD